MEKINFEDATLVKQAYVNIDGTEYPVVDNQFTGGDRPRRRNFKLRISTNAPCREYIYDNN